MQSKLRECSGCNESYTTERNLEIRLKEDFDPVKNVIWKHLTDANHLLDIRELKVDAAVRILTQE